MLKWRGDLKNGDGTLKLGSGAFEARYSYNSRFADCPVHKTRRS